MGVLGQVLNLFDVSYLDDFSTGFSSQQDTIVLDPQEAEAHGLQPLGGLEKFVSCGWVRFVDRYA